MGKNSIKKGQSENRVGTHFYYVSDLLNLLHIALGESKPI